MPIFFALISSFSILFSKLIFLLFISIIPDVGWSIKDNRFNKVDFPDPEGPTIEYIFPDSKWKETSFKTLIVLSLSYFLLIFFIFKV